MQNIREKKINLITALSEDPVIVLQYVQQANLITLREYNNLKDKLSSQTREGFTIDLLDKLIGKRDETCHKFLKLLEQDEMQKAFPLLSDLFTPPGQDNSETDEISEYRMASFPRGVCVIFNNEHFDYKDFAVINRKGSHVDVEALQEVFQCLGFTVEVHIDKTANEMKSLLQELSARDHQGDCFVCCILSHSDSQGLFGTSGIIAPSEILDPFGRATCPSLTDKPKVFVLGADYGHSQYEIPDTDFFLALAATPRTYSYRHVSKGSWFIQSLCKMLKEGCKRGDDILSILYQTINEVSMNKMPNSELFGKQIPHVDLTLRKRLIFPVPGPDPRASEPKI